MRFVDEVASLSTLRAGLARTAQNRGAPGPDGVTVTAFALAGTEGLTTLREEILSGCYEPRPARLVQIAKPGGGHRRLAVGCVRDRVVGHALASVLSGALDDALHRFAWAYRRGRSTAQALAQVEARLAQGYGWVLRGDIRDFFDRIDPALLLRALDEATGDPELGRLVERMLAAGTLAWGAIADTETGTPQGNPVSPFLANLYLVPFDRAMEEAGFEMVRYGDDFCVVAETRAQAQRALEVARGALARLRLELNEQKLAVRHLGEGFSFLGFQFHAGGRRASARAVRRLSERLEAAQRSEGGGEAPAVEDVLRGWISYYGSLAGVDVPPALADVARRLEGLASQPTQVDAEAAGGAAPAPSATKAEAPPLEQDPSAATSGSVAPAERSRWQAIAEQLSWPTGTGQAAALSCHQGELGLDGALWSAVVAALAVRDREGAAELLARGGRFGDAQDVRALQLPGPLFESLDRPATATSAEPTGPAARGPAVTDTASEPPRLVPKLADAERLLALFGGADHTFLRDRKTGERIERERVRQPVRLEYVQDHLAGRFWMAIYPLRANNSVRFAGARVSLPPARRRQGRGSVPVPGVDPEVRSEIGRLVRVLEGARLPTLLSREAAYACTLWVLFAEPLPATRAQALMRRLSEAAGPPLPDVTREIFPIQQATTLEKPGTPVFLPLGVDPRSGERVWIVDEALEPLPDPLGALRGLVPASAAQVASALAGVPTRARTAAVSGPNPPPARTDATSPAAMSAPAAESAPAGPFGEHPRAQQIYQGCAVLRHVVDQVSAGRGASGSERYLITDVLSRLGGEAEGALEGVLRHLDDWRPGMAARLLVRIYPHPSSCGRIRERFEAISAQVGCDCRFRLPPGAYPTPVLHAVGAAEVPGLSDRVREAAARGGVMRAALASMNEGRKEMGARAAALCARLADMRRQKRVIEKTIGQIEDDLDRLLLEAGDEPLETPSGTLRKITDGAQRRFVLEV